MRKEYINLGLVFLVSLVLIVWFLPREKYFSYDYELGKPWNYSPLIADYDFPVLKDSAQFLAEKDSVATHFAPIFVEPDSTIGRRQARLFRSKTQSMAGSAIPAKYIAYYAELIESAYSRGIVTPDHMKLLQDTKRKHIRVQRGNHVLMYPTNMLFTPKSAYDYILSTDTLASHRRFMAKAEIGKYLKSNLIYNSTKSYQDQQETMAAMTDTIGKLVAGQKIIDRGEIITPELLAKINAYHQESEKRKEEANGQIYIIIGQIGLIAMLLGLMVVYLAIYRKDVMESTNMLSMLFALTVIFPICTSVMVDHHFLSVYLLPYAMAAIITRVFIDSRTATMQLIIMLLASSLTLSQPYTFIVTEFIAGLIAIFALREIHARSQVFKVAIMVTAAVILTEMLLRFMQGYNLTMLDYGNIIYKIAGGVLLLFTYPMMYLVEKVFSFTSDVTLIELTNINHPLLRRMSKEAQGTFVHSMQVANLAAEVANKIGGNSQLVRTGALYHDIGKLHAPAFFTENQSSQNPHDQLTEEESANIIISHVTEGIRLAEKYDLPKVIRELIITHHGKSRVGYFYIQAVNKRGEENVNPADFTYTGRAPYTREQAILMMTDAVEAASRSLKEYTEESIHNLVDKIIDAQLAAGNFKNCPINFRDITQAKEVLCESLKTIYHTRIAYPEKKQ